MPESRFGQPANAKLQNMQGAFPIDPGYRSDWEITMQEAKTGDRVDELR